MEEQIKAWQEEFGRLSEDYIARGYSSVPGVLPLDPPKDVVKARVDCVRRLTFLYRELRGAGVNVKLPWNGR